ncbi:hypothetical protein I4U23_011385 [Adineta vaga]|nr:hypothetical protein I4U23_011385 [Adineta vaga]
MQHILACCNDEDDFRYNDTTDFLTFYKEELQYTRYLSDDLSDFLWFQTFRNTLDDIPTTAHAKKLMLGHCRQRYHDNERMLEQIDQFENEYTVNNAIHWYTRPTFIYNLVNTALRTNTMEDMYIFRWYIIDLSHGLRQKWEEQRSLFVSPLNLYRGTTMTSVIFDKLRSYGVGTLTAESSFLSTSRHVDVAEAFAASETLPADSDLVSVLFHITVMDTRNPHGPIFVDTASHTAITDESEILFDMSTLFRITNIFYNESKRTWNVKLVAVPKNEPDFNIRKNFCLSDHEQQKVYNKIQKQMTRWLLFLMVDGFKSLGNKVFPDSDDDDDDDSEFEVKTIASFFGKSMKTLPASIKLKEVAVATVATIQMSKKLALQYSNSFSLSQFVWVEMSIKPLE